MTITTVTSRELNQDVTRAKRATQNGPVIITDRGQPSHVLLSIDDYLALAGDGKSWLDQLAMPGLASINLDGELGVLRNAPMAAVLD